MALDGLFADRELLGDVLVRAALYDAGDDLEFARCEAVGLLLRHGRGLLHEIMQRREQIHDALAADPVVAGENGAQALAEVAGDGVLEHNAACADLQRLDDLLRGNEAGEEHDLHARRAVHDRAHRLQARKLGHGEVEQQNVRLEFECLGNGLVAVVGLTHDLEAGLAGEHVFHAEADDRVVVGHDNTNSSVMTWNSGGLGSGCGFAQYGGRHRLLTLRAPYGASNLSHSIRWRRLHAESKSARAEVSTGEPPSVAAASACNSNAPTIPQLPLMVWAS